MRRTALLLSLTLSVLVSTPSNARALFTLDNDTISVILNDDRFPIDDFDFPAGTTHINNLNLGFYDGSNGFYFNSATDGGNLPLILIGDAVVSGSSPDESLTMTFGNADPPTRFTIELVVRMLGNGRSAIHGTATVTNLLGGGQSLTDTKIFLFTDTLVGASEGFDVTAFDASSGVFYSADTTTVPNAWFGCHSNGQFPMHYEGREYVLPGLAPFQAALAAGDNLADSVEPVAQDQVAGWNWDVGEIESSITFDFAVAADSSLAALIGSLEDALPPNPNLVFGDGFETGNTEAWASP